MNLPADGREVPTQSIDWSTAVAEARILARAGAWLKVLDTLAPLAKTPMRPDSSLSHIEGWILSTFARARLQQMAPIGSWPAALDGILRSRVDLPADTVAGANISIARELAEQGRYAEAMARLVKADEVQASDWLRAHGQILLSRIHARCGRMGDARAAIVKAIDSAQASGSDVLLADAYMRLGHLQRTADDPNSAQRLYAMAATAYWRAGDQLGRSSALCSRALALLVVGQFAESEEAYLDAIRTAQSVGRKLTVLLARLGLAWLGVRRGDLSESRARLLSLWREARDLRAVREEVLALEYLAEAAVLAGRIVQAELAIRCCRRRAAAITLDGDLGVEIKIREAMVLLSKGDARGAARQAYEASVHAHRVGLCWEEAQALRWLGVARVASQQKKSRARHAFSRAHALFDQMDECFERAIVEKWLEACDGPIGWLPKRSHETGEASRSDTDAQSRAIGFWLEHPLLGPMKWLRKRAAAIDGRTSIIRSSQTQASEHAAERTAAAESSPVWADLGLTTCSATVCDLLARAEVLAAGRMPVLLLGETGTGKDLLAQGLHRLSGSSGPFVPVNCASVQRELFAAELFGARKGAYTGAVENRRGLVHEAEKGTLFLDEIADLDLVAQGYLLRFLDTGEVRSLGESRHSRVETRVIAATCRDLRRRISRGLFRKDLYARLSAVVLQMPALRDRLEDFELLIANLWKRHGGVAGTEQRVFTPEVMATLRSRKWPGNVRALAHAVSQMMLFAEQGHTEIGLELLLQQAGPQVTKHGASACAPRSATGASPAAWVLELAPLERRSQASLDRALAEASGSIGKAARILGISRCHAYRLYRQARLR